MVAVRAKEFVSVHAAQSLLREQLELIADVKKEASLRVETSSFRAKRFNFLLVLCNHSLDISLYRRHTTTHMLSEHTA